MNSLTSIESLNSTTKDTKYKSIFDKYRHLRITTKCPIDKPEAIVSIAGATISTPGNITVISGDSKSGKSSFCNVLLAGAIIKNGAPYDGFENLNIKINEYNKAVLHFDTEQSLHHHFLAFKNSILKRGNLDSEPEYFYSYNLRKLDIKQYKAICKELFSVAYNQHGGIHLVLVDGIADFIGSVNDEYESNEIIHFFEQLAIEYNCPVILVVHFNPKSEKQRGHLGSQLQRKAESVLVVKNDAGVSHLEAQFLRSASVSQIPMMKFEYDSDKGYHISRGEFIPLSKEQRSFNELKDLAIKIFSDSDLTYTESIESMIKVTGLSERSCSTRLTKMVENGLITKSDINNYKLKINE